ncbi:MAG TPA: 4-alpha-glucanotransferase [Candidatus Limnocylindria bacterium]|nr:4-alpha-glucanotransferase [Candidatus Limnocylindria bacterium]
MSAADWGVVPRFRGTDGRRRTVSPDVERAILEAMGADAGAAPPPSPVRLVSPGDPLPLPGELVLEDGSSLGRAERLPPDLPFGYHRLLGDDEELLLIAAPPRCPLPVERAWGWAVQLYATRSSGSWGMGDLADLRELGGWARGIGAGFCVVNPLHAVAPNRPQEASPYFPSSRRFRNPLYLRPELVPGAGDEVRSLAARARQLNDDRLIDRDRIAELKAAAIAAAWTDAPRGGAFAAFRAAQGSALDEWATFCTVAERFGGDWHDWPAELRTPRGAAAFAQAHPERVAFHAWLQWLLDEQLAAAAGEIELVGDMAIGFDPAGADAWSWQEQLADGVTIGAPPDTFNARGQDWSLPPFVPHRLRQAGYRPIVETIRANLRHAGGLRIDHIMGLFRLWWVPAGGDPAEGAYVRYPADELLAIVALEAHRANAIVIGEDLGTVEPGVREALAERGILSYRLLMFEPDAARYPELALAAVTTHDLPTIAGLWTGADLEQQRRASLAPDVAGLARLRQPIAGLVPADADVRDAVLAAHARLSGSPALLVAATLEDALAVAERPNLPGTTVEQAPNWSVALPAALEEIERDPFVRRLASVLAR